MRNLAAHKLLFFGKANEAPPILCRMLLPIASLLSAFALLHAPYPCGYDSLSYALAIADNFDIGLNQPHGPGNLFHVLAARGVFLCTGVDPFTAQQLLNLCYLTIMIICLAHSPYWRRFDLVFFATIPLVLFLCGSAVIYGVMFASTALIALFIHRLEQKQGSPIALATAYFFSVGFRQDIALFMAPVVLLALIRRRCSLRQWVFMGVLGMCITASWYIPTSLLSGGLSPYAEAKKIMLPFASSASVFFGATPFQHLRSAVRFIIYAVAAAGPGGIVYIVASWRSLQRQYRPIAIAGVLPFMAYGIAVYFGYPYYYATPLGFYLTWSYLNSGSPFRSPFLLLCSVINIVFFIFVPIGHKKDLRTFSERPLKDTIVKQLSYLAANSLQELYETRRFAMFIDNELSKCKRFADRDYVGHEGVRYERYWRLMARLRWRNEYVVSPDSLSCIIGYKQPEDVVHAQFENIFVRHARSCSKHVVRP